MRNIIKRAIKGAGGKLLNLADRIREPKLFGPENIFGLDQVAGIYPTTILSALRTGPESSNRIILGRDVYLGRRVELEAGGPGGIEIDEDTSLQDGCAVRGWVKIGAHCLFGHNALVISTSHQFRHKPEWLIRDQDQDYLRQASRDSETSVRIDDDCWLGWGCTVMPGVHIGRGAILAANSVVTNNVGPYEIHGGVPNRKIGERLAFMPPAAISALNDGDLPYFYRGFRQRRNILEQSRGEGLIDGRAAAAIVLAGLPSASIALKGRCMEGHTGLNLRFWLNGADLGCRTLPAGAFDLALTQPADGPIRPVAAGLAVHTVLEWREETRTADRDAFADAGLRYGIASAELL